MAKRTFCDRCDTDTTGEKSGHVMGIDYADDDGGGTITTTADLCASCYQAFLQFVKLLPLVNGRRSGKDA